MCDRVADTQRLSNRATTDHILDPGWLGQGAAASQGTSIWLQEATGPEQGWEVTPGKLAFFCKRT